MQSIGMFYMSGKKKKNDKYRSTKDGHKHLCTIMPEFQENDGLSTILFRST